MSTAAQDASVNNELTLPTDSFNFDNAANGRRGGPNSLVFESGPEIMGCPLKKSQQPIGGAAAAR
jgi:hypothetical protein